MRWKRWIRSVRVDVPGLSENGAAGSDVAGKDQKLAEERVPGHFAVVALSDPVSIRILNAVKGSTDDGPDPRRASELTTVITTPTKLRKQKEHNRTNGDRSQR